MRTSARSTQTAPRRTAALLALLLALATLAAPALAGETFKVTPSLALRETYDTNVNFNGAGDFEHSAAPGLRVDMQQERSRSWIQARGSAYKYMRLSEYDHLDQNYDAGLEFNATQNTTLNLKGSFIADSAFSSALADTGVRARRALRQVLSVQPSATFNLDETNALTLLYSFAKTEYDTKDYTDSMSNTLSGLWGFRMNERTQLLLQLSGTRAETSTAQQDSVSSMGGFEYALAETLKARVLAGFGSMRTTLDNAPSRTASSYTADTSLEWRLEKLVANAGYSRDMTLGISGDDLVRDKLSMNLSLSTAERLQLQLGSTLVLSENSSSAQSPQSNRWLEILPSVKYQTGEYSFLTFGYAYGAAKDQQKDELRTRNRLYLDFNISFP